MFSNVVPLNGEVALSRDQIISTGNGVTYSTDRGLFLMTGRSVTNLTELIEGEVSNIKQVNSFLGRVNNSSLIQLSSSLSSCNMLEYIKGSKLGYNKVQNELLVSNPNFNYSYVYSFESNAWSKKSESYRVLINSYPELLVLRENNDQEAENGIFSLSEEDNTRAVQTLLVTRPLKLDNDMNFILIHRALQRCELNVKLSTYAGFYVFGSNDLMTWQLLRVVIRKPGR